MIGKVRRRWEVARKECGKREVLCMTGELGPESGGSAAAGARPPLPPFTLETARQKVQAAEDAWNTRDPERVSLAYTTDSTWRNRDVAVTGRAAIVELLTAKWERELDYALRKNLWGFRENRMAVRFQYESRDVDGAWWRSYGNELWEFDEYGLMSRREASINDVAISAGERRIFGPRPERERGLEFPIW
jgi:nuclear transport factor 2 (NTF2) superfamily protein